MNKAPRILQYRSFIGSLGGGDRAGDIGYVITTIFLP